MEHEPTVNAAFLAIALKAIMVYRDKVCSDVKCQCKCRIPVSNNQVKMRIEVPNIKFKKIKQNRRGYLMKLKGILNMLKKKR